MRIERLYAEDFGAFRERSWEGIPDGLTVWYGPNEAGKSTLLDFIRVMLWGKSSHGYGRYKETEMSGSLWLSDGKDQLRLRRRGSHAPDIVLNDDVASEELLGQWLNQVPLDVFENVYAFGLGELERFESLSSEGVAGRIYSAGLGTGKLSVVDLHEGVVKAREELWRKRGKVQPIAVLIAECDAIRTQIGERGSEPEQYQQLDREREALEREVTASKSLVRELRDREMRLSRVLERGAEARRRQTLIGLLGDLGGVPDWTSGEVADIRKLIGQRSNLQEQRELVDQEWRETDAPSDIDKRADWSRSHETEALEVLRHLEQVETQLAERQEQYGRSQQALVTLTAAWPAGFQTAAERLSRQGRDDEILALEVSYEATMTIRRRLDDEEEKLRERDAEVKAHEASLPSAPTMESIDEIDRWQSLIYSVLEARDAIGWKIPGTLLVLAVVSSIAGLGVSTEVVQGVFYALAGCFVLAGGYLLWQASKRPAGDALVRELDAVRQRLGLGASDARGGMGDLLAQLAKMKDEALRYRTWRDRLQVVGTQREAARTIWSQSTEELLAAEATLDGAMRGLGLGAFAYGTIRSWMRDMGPLRSAVAAVEHTQKAFQATRAERDELWIQARNLTRLWNPTVAEGASDARIPAMLAETLEEARTALQKARDLAKLEERMGMLDGQIESLEGGIQAALEGSRVSTEAFPDMVERWQQKMAWISERDTIQAHWDALETEDREVLEAWNEATELQLREALREVKAHIDQKESEVSKSATRLGALTQQIRDMERGHETSTLHQRLSEKEAALDRLVREWARYQLVDQALIRARKVFEKERQPNILKAAASLFEHLTDGRYPRVLASLEGPGHIRVEDREGRPYRPAQLSRGTQEQLYLAIRLAWVQEMDRGTERRLPLLLDDILVNFDEGRLRRTLEVLAQMAETHQVLMWTCHPYIVEEARRVQAIEIEAG